MRLHDLEGKRVLYWGAGREAKAFVIATRHLGIDLTLTITSEDEGGATRVEDISVVPFDANLIKEADVVVRTPGVSRYRPELINATVTTNTDLWFGEAHAPTIAITGTKGKSTTSSLTAHILNQIGIKAQLAGNIGKSPLELIGEAQPNWWILELSSYQISDLTHSPDIGVLTNLSQEHLDWHGGFENYVNDKLNLFAHNPSIVSVVNAADKESLNRSEKLINRRLANNDVGVHVQDGYVMLGEQPLFERSRLRLIGKHNEQLLGLVLSAVQATGLDLVENKDEIASAVEKFEALPHRLQPVGEINGVTFINDSLSTTPVASIAAMEAFAPRPTTLLAGGHDRGLEYENLAEYISSHDNVRVLALPSSGPRIAEEIKKVCQRSDAVEVVDSLEEAVQLAKQETPSGGVVLLSPGAASFGHFRDYAERGEKFAQYVLGDN